MNKETVIPIDEVCWVFYYENKSYDKKGKPDSKFYINICCKDGNILEYEFSDILAALLLKEFDRKHPHIILGYSRELETLFRNERDEFMTKADSMRPESIYEFKAPQL
jgi:hypothetical protein